MDYDKNIDWFREAERLREIIAASRTVNKIIAKDNKRLEGEKKGLKEEISNIETHIEMLMDAKELKRIGADNHPKQRDLHHRVMRILAAYNKQALQKSEARDGEEKAGSKTKD